MFNNRLMTRICGSNGAANHSRNAEKIKICSRDGGHVAPTTRLPKNFF
jgi:hypothetical protein